MSNLFNSKKKREVAVSGFTNLLAQPGWALLRQYLDVNIKACVERILTKKDLGESLTNKQLDRERDKLAIFQEVKNLPTSKIKEFTASEQKEPNPDPYYTKEELKTERKKAG